MTTDQRESPDGSRSTGGEPTVLRGAIERFRSGASGRWAVAILAAVAGVVVFGVATELFPYNSVNHDEGVYLQQAQLLLEGRIGMDPATPGAVRPWFFVRDGDYLYPKYAPVPAAIFALGELLGGFRVSLAAVAAANVALTCALGRAAFDRETGLLAGVLLLATPSFLITSSVFLPYAPTTALNLAFALAYVRAARTDGVGYAALAGVAIGLAFFARPYTAVLFAAPFVVHAVWTLAVAVRSDAVDLRPPLLRQAATATLGTAFVGVTLAYNAATTGDPFLFPFEAFAPRDGLGFGQRRILDHAVEYTPALALRANAHLWYETATRWTVAAPIGTVLFALGAGRQLFGPVGDRLPAWLADRIPGWKSADAAPESAPRSDGGDPDPDAESTDTERTADGSTGPTGSLPPGRLRWILLGAFASVVVGNLYFWGNYNVLATLSDPTDGFVAGFGPIYHFDALVVLALFGAAGARWLWTGIRAGARRRIDSERWRRVALAGVLVAALVGGGFAQVTAMDGPVEGHVAYTERYAETYEPIERTDFDRAVVFVPSAYGPWLNHPFQSLRNDPAADGSLEGPVVYARDRGPAGDFAVLSAYPDRRPYRFNYRGQWTPDPADRVTPKLRRLHLRRGDAVTVRTEVSVPPRVRSGYVRVSAAGEGVSETIPDPDGDVVVEWRLTEAGVEIASVTSGGRRLSVDAGENETVPLDGPREVALAVTFATPDGATVTYRQELDARVHDGAVEVIWPPESSVCRLVSDCGLEGTYLPDHPEKHRPGIAMNATVAVTGDDPEADR